MNITYTLLGAGGIGLIAGFIIAYVIRGAGASREIKAAEKEAKKIVDHANHQSATLIKEAELEVKDRMRRLAKKENKLDHLEMEADALIEEQKTKLEKISGMTADAAKELLVQTMENEARHDGAKLIKQIESETKAEADKKAKAILSTVIQRYAGDFVMERTVSVVPLPSDDMKGRIIGREGRNIRAIEAATGIDLIIDDTPEAVILSGFNPVRREVARLTLQRLIADGRIHPARIEDMVKKVEKEVEVVIKEAWDPPRTVKVDREPKVQDQLLPECSPAFR